MFQIPPVYQILYDSLAASNLDVYLTSSRFQQYLLQNNLGADWAQLALFVQAQGLVGALANRMTLHQLLLRAGSINPVASWYMFGGIILDLAQANGGVLKDKERVTAQLQVLQAPATFIQQLETQLGTGDDNQAKGSQGHSKPAIDPVDKGIRVFISHAHEDQAIAEALIDLIEGATNIDSSEIRCTSVGGSNLGPGDHVSETLKDDLNNCQVVLGLITASSKQSDWVMFELGAAWAMGKAWALRGDGVRYRDIPGPLKQHHAISITDEDGLFSLVKHLGEVTGAQVAEIDKVNRVVGRFLENS